MDFTQVVNTLFKLGVAMAVGYLLRKMKRLGDEANQALSWLILNITCPALIIFAVCGQGAPNGEVLRLVGFGAVLYIALPLLALLLTPAFFAKADKRGVYRMLLVFGNVNFMGFPVAQALYGEQAVFFMNLLNIPFTLLMFTYGLRQLRPVGAAPSVKTRLADILTPGLFAGLLSLAIYFMQIPIPGMVVGALGFIGGVTTPLSMVVIGSLVADFSFQDVFADWRVFLISGFKLLLLPVLGFFAARVFFPGGTMAGIITVSLAMPSASLCAMVCKQYGTPAQTSTAVLGILISTVLSMATLPLMLLFLH